MKKLQRQESKTFSTKTKEKVTLFSTSVSMSNLQMIIKEVVLVAPKEVMVTLLAVVLLTNNFNNLEEAQVATEVCNSKTHLISPILTFK